MNPNATSRNKIYTLTKIAICITLLIISSYFIIPLPFTPVVITAQTLIIHVIALVLTPKQAFATMGIYLFAGLIGLPVFSGGISGPAKLFGPTGGFLFGFLIAVVVISLLKGKKIYFWRYLLVTLGVGTPIIYLCGVLMMCSLQDMTIQAALMSAVVPFLLGDVLKAIAASFIATILNKRLLSAN